MTPKKHSQLGANSKPFWEFRQGGKSRIRTSMTPMILHDFIWILRYPSELIMVSKSIMKPKKNL
jgi:hypothetical protein